MTCKPTPTCIYTCDRGELCPHPRVCQCSYCHETRECVEHHIDLWGCATCLGAIVASQEQIMDSWETYLREKLAAIDARLDRISKDRPGNIAVRITGLETQMQMVVDYFDGKRYRKTRR